MKILVTGGAGFIGSTMVNLLESREHSVAVIDNLSTGKLENLAGKLPQTAFYLQDVRNPEIEKIFDIERPELVVHFAAQASVIDSVLDPAYDADVNLMGLLNLLRCSMQYGVRKFVFISTGGAIYGDADVIPTPETYVPEVLSPYALTKHTSESYLKIYNKLHGLSYSVLRLANVYGPRRVPKGECGVIPIYFERCLANEDAKLFTYADMPDGTYRDYVYVDDVCDAVLRCLDGGDGEIFNVGTGVETSTRSVFDMIKRLTGSRSELVVEGERAGDVRRGILDAGKLRRFGWSPKVDIEEGLRRTYLWLRGE